VVRDRDTQTVQAEDLVTAAVAQGGGVSYGKGFERQALMRLNRIKAAVDRRDLSALKGNRFEKLKGDRAGSYSIRINDQWRIAFRIEANRALDVTIEDYH
jgi:toxin HigB-1